LNTQLAEKIRQPNTKNEIATVRSKDATAPAKTTPTARRLIASRTALSATAAIRSLVSKRRLSTLRAATIVIHSKVIEAIAAPIRMLLCEWSSA
jgi:hypothetical protein